jgi:hypothetical protein
MMSNKGLNSNDALEESTTTSSSVMLSGMRREKEIARFLAIKEYSRDRRNSYRDRAAVEMRRLYEFNSIFHRFRAESIRLKRR